MEFAPLRQAVKVTKLGGHGLARIPGHEAAGKHSAIVGGIAAGIQVTAPLLGIQTRAGCSCAGPYGHRLLGIDDAHSDRYRRVIQQGRSGLKPGWCRVGFHYVFDDAEVEYLIGAVEFLAEHGHRFVPQYQFDAKSGRWQHKQWQTPSATFSISEALQSTPIRARALPEEARRQRYKNYLEQALRLAEAAGD